MFLWRGQEQLLKRNSVWKRMFRKIKTFEANYIFISKRVVYFFRFIVTTFLLLWYYTLCLTEAIFPDRTREHKWWVIGSMKMRPIMKEWELLKTCIPSMYKFSLWLWQSNNEGQNNFLPFHQTNPHKQGLFCIHEGTFFTNLLLLLIIWLTIVCFI